MSANKMLGFLNLLVRFALPVVILAAGWFAYSNLSVEIDETKDPPEKKQAIRTTVMELRVQDYPLFVKTHGFVQPHNEVSLRAQVSGKITYISPAFETGSYFSKGDLLVQLESKDYKTAVAVAAARKLGADSALQLAKLNEERHLRLVKSNAVSKADVERASATREQALADLDSADAQLQRANLDLDRTKIWAPFDGRVRLKIAGLGQIVGQESILGTVFAVDYVEVRLPISGKQLQFLNLPEFAEDSPVEVELRDAISEGSDTLWKARIVRTEGVLDEDSRELFAIAQVDDPFGKKSGDPPLRIGQPVTASIVGKVLKNVIALPRVAVRQLDQINLVDKTSLILMPKTIDPIWEDKEHVIVQDPMIQDGMLLSTTHLVYVPSGTKVEIIPDINLDTEAVADSTNDSEAIIKQAQKANSSE